MPDLTPMKRQYKEIKSQYRDCLLFFRLGDFYEMFDEDAVTGSKELDLTLTTRDRGVENPEERTPMCGVPYHAAETYIAKLVAKGYKVAICEQTEDPAKAVGLVSRDVIRIITPGTVTESSMLDESKNNYICAIETGPASAGIAFCDISTGEFSCTSFEEDQISHILNELGRFAPREAVLSQGAAEIAGIRNFLTEKLGALIECGQEGFEYLEASARVCEQFKAQSVDELGLGESPAAVSAAGALLAYLKETQKFDLSHISSPEVSYVKKYMELDWVTARSLELTESQSESDFNVMKAKIEELKEKGIKFYLDDFGTGYSNMERIMELPFDIIKFDRSLVVASGTSERSERIVGNLANLFNELDYSVLYEGVETDSDESMCREMSASYLQGYKYSRPIPIEELRRFAEKRNKAG